MNLQFNKWDTHTVDKIGVILSGRFSMTVQEQCIILEAGEILVVPKDI